MGVRLGVGVGVGVSVIKKSAGQRYGFAGNDAITLLCFIPVKVFIFLSTIYKSA
jgi:hypothetical protein